MPAPIVYSEWKATAVIDFITITRPSVKLRDVHELSLRGHGTIKCGRKWGQVSLTVHDPDREALQALIDLFPGAEIWDLEVSVDFRLRDGSGALAKLRQAHTWLKASLFPQNHPQMAGVSHRKAYEPSTRKVRRIGLKPTTGSHTVYWENRTAFEQVRLYVKTKDKHISPVIPSTRIEATLNRGGCQQAGVPRLESLPDFASRLRRYISPFFEVTKGIKPKITRTRSTSPGRLSKAAHDAKKEQDRIKRSWSRFGAAWAAKHGYKTVPDTQANRMIGGALNALRRDLIKLRLP